MSAFVDQLRSRVEGHVRADEPLAAHTTLRVGGPAAALVSAETPADLAAVAEVCLAHDRPWLVLGRGSNLLVADAGWPGAVVTLGRGFRGVEIQPQPGAALPGAARGLGSAAAADVEVLPVGAEREALSVGYAAEAVPVGAEVRVVAGAAEPMPVLARTVARHMLGGLAFGVAIPGSLGGAVRMNAGAHGTELREVLDWADVARLGKGGAVERWSVADLAPGYRHTALPADGVVVRAGLRLRRGQPEELDADMAEMRRWRREHQPINQPSCGSVFRNPPGDSAGRLIEAAGMKDHRVGRARVSPVHANFITVAAGAKAADVAQVIADVRAAVLERHGTMLETEVVLAGFDP